MNVTYVDKQNELDRVSCSLGRAGFTIDGHYSIARENPVE